MVKRHKMSKTIILCLFFSAFTTLSFSQVNGRVVDATSNSALPGASILLNTGKLVTSNEKGEFFLPQVSNDSINLLISYIGYQKKSISVAANDSDILISLEPIIHNLEEINVSVSGFSENIQTSTGSISLINRQELDARNNIVLNDALNQIPGLYMAGGGYNTNRLTIRGIGSRSPYSSNRIRAYLDEIPLTSGDGTSNIEDLDMSLLSRVEVLKGASSAVYGSGLGGVVRFWPYEPANEGFSLGIRAEYASFGTYKTSIRTAFKAEKSSSTLGYSHSNSDGYRQNSEYARNSLLFRSLYDLKKTDLKFTVLYTGVEAQIPSSITKTSFLADPRNAAPTWLAIKGYEKYNKILAGLSAQTKISNNLVNTLAASVSYSDPYESRPFNILDDNSTSINIKESIHISRGKIDIIAGVEAFLESYNWLIFKTLSGIQGELINNFKEKRYYVNTNVLGRYIPSDKFILEFGVNMNILNYSLDYNFNPDSSNQSAEFNYQPILSPKIGLNYKLNSSANIHASISHGFSHPSLEETLLPDGQVNTDLKPESGWNWDLGILGESENRQLKYNLNIYHISLRNLLVTQRISDDVFSGINAGKTYHTGIEAYLGMNLLSPEIRKLLQIEVSSTLTAASNRFVEFIDDSKDYSGNILPGIPSLMINNELRLNLRQNFEVSFLHKFNGKQFMNDANTAENPVWNTIDFRCSYSIHLGKRKTEIKAYVGVRNMLNEEYAGMILVNAPSFGGAEPRYYYPALPRTYFIGLNVDL